MRSGTDSFDDSDEEGGLKGEKQDGLDSQANKKNTLKTKKKDIYLEHVRDKSRNDAVNALKSEKRNNVTVGKL